MTLHMDKNTFSRYGWIVIVIIIIAILITAATPFGTVIRKGFEDGVKKFSGAEITLENEEKGNPPLDDRINRPFLAINEGALNIRTSDTQTEK